MKKLVPLLMSLMLPLGAWAQSSPNMDAANQAIISTCQTEGGTFISYKDDKCEYSGCAYVGKNGDVSYDGDNQRVTGGCDLKSYQAKAKTAYKADIDKKIADAKAEADKKVKDLEEKKKQADKIGKKPGDGSLEYGDLNGDGVIDDLDRAIAEERLRNGGKQSGAQSGSQSGAQSGAQSGSQSGSGETRIGDDGRLYCEELEGAGVIEKGGLCYDECKPKRSFPLFGKKKEGFERKKCVECLLKYPGVYNVKKEYLPKDKNGKIIGDKSVNLGKGVTVKTGVIICKDSKGNIVSHTGTVCPSGTVLHGGSTVGSGNGSVTVIGGATVGSGSGNGSVTVIGGAVGGAVGGGNGGLQLPAVCSSTKNKDKKACQAWIDANARFLCSSGSTSCPNGYNEIMSRYSVDGCVNCQASRSNRGSTLSGIAEIAGAVMGPLAQFGSAYVGARAYQKGQEAWAGAATAGFEQCRLAQGNYLQYLQANELPGMTPDQQANMNCNGYQLSGYAGLGGMYGNYLGAGYSNGFIGGMMGPYGMYNPYGMGGYVGGAVGGYVGGVGIAGGITSGLASGYYGGYAGGLGLTNGYVAGGYVAGGYAAGMAGGYVNGTYMGGYPYSGGIAAGGLVNGISLAGGVAGGMYPGYAGGMYTSGYGLASGYAGGMGIAGGIGIAGGMNGGMYPGGMYPGGWGSGTGNYGYGNYYGANSNYGYNNMYASQQASNIDAMLQQQGMSYQMGSMSGGYNGYNAGYGSYYPSNMGMGLNLNIGGGFYGGF